MHVQSPHMAILSYVPVAVCAFLHAFPFLCDAQRAFRNWRDRCRERNHWPSDDNPLHRKHWMTYMPGDE